MDLDSMRYVTGEDVHAGDRIQHCGTYGRVVFVSDGVNEEFAPGYEDHTGKDRGVIVCDDDGSTTALGEPNELLSFLDRG